MNKTYRILFYRRNGTQKYPVSYRLSRSIPLRKAKKMLGIKTWIGDSIRLTPDGGALLANGKYGLGNRLVFAYHSCQMKGRKV
jgi:hypothetical protein